MKAVLRGIRLAEEAKKQKSSHEKQEEKKVTKKKKRSAPKANDGSFDAANDSDTTVDDSQASKRPKIYLDSLEKAKKGNLKDFSPAALHSQVLDEPNINKVTVADFEFGADKNENVKVATTESAKRAAGEDLASVSSATRAAIDVQPGKANRELLNRSINTFEQKNERRAMPEDAKSINRIMQKQKIEEDRAQHNKKWQSTCDDSDVVAIAGDVVKEKFEMVHERIEANSVEDYERRNASRSIVSGKALEEKEIIADEEPLVHTSEITTSPTGHLQSARATTPAPGTEQRENIERGLDELEKRNVVVSSEARIAKLATSVPPSVVVQGRTLDSSTSMGANIFGDGSIVQSPIDFAVQPLVEKSQSDSTLVHDALSDMFARVHAAVKRFYDTYDAAAEDTEFHLKHVEYAQAFKHRMHEEVRRHFPKPDSQERLKIREFLADLFTGLPPDQRKQAFLEQLKSGRYAEGTAEREALADAVLVGANPVAASELDVQEAAKNAATKWQMDAEVEALKRKLPDIDDDELAEQLSHGLDAENNVMLRMVQQHATNDVLFRNEDDAPVTLQRENETIYNGHETNVLPEAKRISQQLLSSNDYMNMMLKKQHSCNETAINYEQ